MTFYAVSPIINGLSFPSLLKVISIGSWNKDELFASGIRLILYSVGQNLYSNDNSKDPPRFFLIFLLSRLNKKFNSSLKKFLNYLSHDLLRISSFSCKTFVSWSLCARTIILILELKMNKTFTNSFSTWIKALGYMYIQVMITIHSLPTVPTYFEDLLSIHHSSLVSFCPLLLCYLQLCESGHI